MHAVDILVVETDARLRDQLLDALWRHRVTVVADGVSALRHLTHAKCLPSVVILDNDLPDACGLTVLGAMRADERTLSTPVILMGSDPKVRDDAWLADAFVMKPFNTCDIGALVARVSHPRRQTPVEQLLMSRS